MAEGLDALIVGAGPAGSATAQRLAREGHRVLLIDRATFPRDKPCSEYSGPETVRHLADLGVLETLERAGVTALEGTAVTGSRGSRLVGRFARAGGTPYRATGLALPRPLLDAALVRAAATAGVQVVSDHTAIDLLRDGRGVHGVRLRDRSGRISQCTARVVIGADGLGSVVARRAGLRRQGWLRRMAFVTHVEQVPDLGHAAELHVGREGYIGLNPLGGGVTNVALVLPVGAVQAGPRVPAELLRAHLARYPGLSARVDLARRVSPIRVVGPFDAMVRRSVTDGLLLVGDAADFFDPFTGEGIHSALLGAELAASVLHTALQTEERPDARSLRRYRTLRRKAFLGKWVVERLIGYGMLAPALFDRAVARLEGRGMADTLIGVTGSFVSPWRVVNPGFLVRMVV